MQKESFFYSETSAIYLHLPQDRDMLLAYFQKARLQDQTGGLCHNCKS